MGDVGPPETNLRQFLTTFAPERLESFGMSTAPQPWQLLIVSLAGWVNRHQQHVIDYLIDENRVLKDQLRGRRRRLSDDERRRLAVNGKVLGWKLQRSRHSMLPYANVIKISTVLDSPTVVL